ncbi:hypothetical protein G4G28_16365 [Massilia sp. Dwa41.01b]|uniref:hypothetical protein n=1 Tax=Massilia sp. Dwa41.01b TaxID=2709302 RepID=UPI001603EC93|nr:hypothetical protein [Massilia sp. Dwa41.01b]QNA89648.1 hypothetical protein G4G28_16365 [Massilia sp. Dwa41.01b]
MTRYVRVVRALAGLLALLQLAYFMLSWMFPEPLHAGPIAMQFFPRGLAPGAVAGLAPRCAGPGSPVRCRSC